MRWENRHIYRVGGLYIKYKENASHKINNFDKSAVKKLRI
ncbi:unknown [[Mannheimia] succiniciproducens MBEL55E]|uniref:Uncharacterized protein n=1 Tax=Mannheimia succiniciproducens (strain KCTC 0769BP / MBEL55E) TaxID=221988 RepID=Q65T19_MANSM|nr:unknown [[Mannheimia] succiniciproducens MBEL55E]